jgi:DHA2 family multidrug resistance protein
MQLVITPDSGEEHLYWPLILRGVGLGYLYPFLHYHYQLKREEYRRRSSIYWMMRQLGGSFGIAIITTLSLDSINIVNLVSHLNSASSKSKTVQQLKLFHV